MGEASHGRPLSIFHRRSECVALRAAKLIVDSLPEDSTLVAFAWKRISRVLQLYRCRAHKLISDIICLLENVPISRASVHGSSLMCFDKVSIVVLIVDYLIVIK